MDLKGLLGRRNQIVEKEDALPGRNETIALPATHEVLGTPLSPPWPEGYEQITVAGGCFWGVEKMFWELSGVHTTLVGYAGGYIPNPTYQETCSGQTGHTEAVQIVYDPQKVELATILKTFWEGHNPTQGMRQGNDIGTQYRSMILWTTLEQKRAAEESKRAYQEELERAGYGKITTEIQEYDTMYPAEKYHQQYLAKNPGGYCGHGGTGISCPVGVKKMPQTSGN